MEGEHDDISGVGQTEAAHVLCSNIPADDKAHYLQPAVGHYGVFNGSRFRAEIAPRISDFVLSHNGAGKRRAKAATVPHAARLMWRRVPRQPPRRRRAARPSSTSARLFVSA